jgi:acetyl-CoA carboxylase biotin carboxyl carrier protein
MEMSPETIKALLDAFDQSDWREMIVTVGEDRLHVSRDPLPEGALATPAAPASGNNSGQTSAAPADSAAGPGADATPTVLGAAGSSAPRGAPASAPPTAEPAAVNGTAIESPSVGLFWRSPSPGAPPFVEVGDQVEAGQTVAIVEVMKLMNHVASPVEGVVTAILVENGGAVEFGQTIVVVDPEG